MLGLETIGIGARFRSAGSLGLGRLLGRRLEQVGERVREPDQNTGLDQEDDGMENHTAKIGAAGIDGGRENEVQRQMMQRDCHSAGDDGPIVAIGDQARQGGEEVHVHVDLPGVAGELKDEHRHAGHQGDGDDHARRRAVSRNAPRRRRG
ncbi:hypothetical protein MTX20_13340 [Bradyrhizobium sp. ISRA435]|nr:hypothetical protein MTX20_13340 [Bradyrhizobium sp. ISRA435]